MEEDLNLRILGVTPGDEIAGARKLTLNTSRGPIPFLLHASTEAGRAVLCICGAIGGFDGPARLYAQLGLDMPHRGFTILRLNYRAPNDFTECLLDTMAGVTFLKGMHHSRTILIGHSFGGAVAVNAGTLSPEVSGVIAISSQLAGAHVVGELAPRPILLIHGTGDTVLSHQCSEVLYKRAAEPKTLKLFPGAGHRLTEVADELAELVTNWIVEKS